MNLNELKQLCDQGKYPDFYFFWGHTPKNPQITDASCLSQWFPAQFTIDEHTYATAEHYMMAAKARLFDDQLRLNQILQAKSAFQAKKLGRMVAGFNDRIWLQHREDIVFAANLAKFSQHPELSDFLLSTRNKVLVEASPYDKVWGIGMARDHAHADQPRNWKGLNLLGFSLMRVRQQLAQKHHGS